MICLNEVGYSNRRLSVQDFLPPFQSSINDFWKVRVQTNPRLKSFAAVLIQAGLLLIKKNHVGFTIGTVGRLVEKKGIDTLIDAAALLKSKGHTFQVVIAGSGPLEINLKQQAYELGLDQTEVQFIGALSHDKVADFISTLDVFVLPCKQDSQGDMDGIPVVLMEAMLCNVPVISTQISGIPELVIHNVSGLLTPPGDAEQLAESIIRLRRTLDLQHQLQKGGQEIVNKKFLLDKNVIRLIELIKANNKNP